MLASGFLHLVVGARPTSMAHRSSMSGRVAMRYPPRYPDNAVKCYAVRYARLQDDERTMAGRDLKSDSEWPADCVPSLPLPADLVRALGWLRSNLSEPIDLETLASVAGVRPRTLETHFRAFLGATPLGWVR